MNIYLLQCSIMIPGEDYNLHKENVFSSLELARKVGMKILEDLLRKYYDGLFDYGAPKKLSRDELFQLSVMYDFSITEFDPAVTDKIEKLEYTYDECFLHEPTHKVYSYDYNGQLNYIEVQYKTIHDKHNGIYEIMKPSDFAEGAGNKFSVGDIVTIKQEKKQSYFESYQMADRLHVITGTPTKKEGQKYFDNTYHVITNHNKIDDGCHKDSFREDELQLYTGVIDKDSPIYFLSQIYQGNIEISHEKYMDLISGRIALNNAPSFREIEEFKKGKKK